MSEPIIRTLRKSDYPALIDVVRRRHYTTRKPVCWRPRPTGELSGATCAFTANSTGTSRVDSGNRVDALDHRRPLNTHHQFLRGSRLVRAKDGLKPPAIFWEFSISMNICVNRLRLVTTGGSVRVDPAAVDMD